MDDQNQQTRKPRRHPLFGSMKGTLTIAPGVDLTAPSCPDFDAYAERKYGPESRLGKLWAEVVERENLRTADHSQGRSPDEKPSETT
jgi:hypothetical protein